MLTFAIADLHGRYDLLILALKRIRQHSPDGGTIVFLGDYVDRGPCSAQILAYLKKGPQLPEWKWVILMGNHEDMMIQCVTGRAEIGWWYGNGGYWTQDSYINSGNNLDEHVKWLAGLPLWYEDAHRIYVHAYVDPLKPMEKQDRDTMLWAMYNHNKDHGHTQSGKHVVHGHHQFEDGPKLCAGRTNLDTFAWYTGRLVVGVFSGAGGPVETLEVKGMPFVR